MTLFKYHREWGSYELKTSLLKVIQKASKEYADIEHILACHGGDTNKIAKEARKSPQTTKVTYKEAVQELIRQDSEKRIKPVGILDDYNFMNEVLDGNNE